MEVIVLAGGLGTRLRSEVPNLPKPLAPVGEHPFLYHLLAYWKKQGVRRIILSVGYQWEKIQEAFGPRFLGDEVVYSIEEEPLGTAGGMIRAMNHLKGSAAFLVLNGDTFFEVSLADMRELHARTRSQFTVALTPSEMTSRYNEVFLKKERVLSFSQRRLESSSSGWVNGGAYLIQPEQIPFFKSLFEGKRPPFSLEETLFPSLLERGVPVFGYRCSGRFLDIGVPEDYRRAPEFFCSHFTGAT